MAPTSGYLHFGWRSTQSVEHGTVWESLRVLRQCLQGFMQGFMMLNAVVFQALWVHQTSLYWGLLSRLANVLDPETFPWLTHGMEGVRPTFSWFVTFVTCWFSPIFLCLCSDISDPVTTCHGLSYCQSRKKQMVLVLRSFFLFAWTMAKPKLLTKKHDGLKQHGCGCCSKLDPFSHLMFL